MRSAVYKVSELVRSTHSDDGGIVLDIQRDRLLRLNRTGSAIFQHVQEAQTELEIIDNLSQEFGICQTVARQDVANFLRSLEEHGLIYRQILD